MTPTPNAPRVAAGHWVTDKAWHDVRTEIEALVSYAQNGPTEHFYAARDNLARELAEFRSAAPNAPTAAQVERAARAMCEWDDVYNNAMRGIGPWASLIEHTREHYRSQARAALTTALAAPAPVAAGGEECPEGAQETADQET